MRISFAKKTCLSALTLNVVFIGLLLSNVASADITLINPDKFEKDGDKTQAELFADTAGFDVSDESATVDDIIAVGINALLSLLGVAFLVLTVYGGIVLFQARGDENEVKKAQKIIEQGVIGLVIVLGAFAIASFVIDRFAEQTLTK